MHFSIDRTVHTTAFDKPVVDHWLERKIAQTAAGCTEKDRSDDRPLQRRARYRLSYIPLLKSMIVDNCPAHPKLKYLKAIELIILPPNTSQTQPMAQGFINWKGKVLFNDALNLYGYMASDIW